MLAATQLEDGAAALGLSLSPSQRDQLLAYQALMAQWNQVYNLTAIRDPREMLTHHLFDSLAVLGPLRQQAPSLARLLDVGSGAGLPGVVIAILRSEVQVVCVDAVGKKISFIRQVAAELGLPNVTGEHCRVEQLRSAPFDVITARAFASLAEFTRLTRRLLSPQGVWMALKGKTPADEIAALPPDVRVFHVEQLCVPDLGAERCLVWMRATGLVN